MIDKLKQKKHGGFTLIEMLIVLLVLAVLILIFVPNLNTQREKISAQEQDAFEQVVVNQIELYTITEDKAPSGKFDVLQAKGYLTKKQTDKATKLWTSIEDFNKRDE